MSLAHIAAPSAAVQVGDTSLIVKAFSVDTLAQLIYKQREGLEPIFDAIEAKGVRTAADIQKLDPTEIGMMLLTKFPDFMADLIAHAVGEPELAENAKNLRAPVQMTILREAMRLTFVDESEFHELLGNVLAAVRVLSRTLPQNPLTSPDSFASPAGTTA